VSEQSLQIFIMQRRIAALENENNELRDHLRNLALEQSFQMQKQKKKCMKRNTMRAILSYLCCREDRPSLFDKTCPMVCSPAMTDCAVYDDRATNAPVELELPRTTE